MELVDTHCHLNDGKFTDDIADVISRARVAGVTRIINMGDTTESSAQAVRLANGHDGLFAAVGIHPENAFDMTDRDDERLYSWAKNKKVVAIGEIGLDYYWEHDEEKRLLQRRIFVRQLDIARQANLPVCIHDRDAHGDTLKILQNEGRGLRGVLHCFSGSAEMAAEIFKLGFFIGVDGPLTYKNAAKLPQIVAGAPRDMVLLETDAPYLAPVPVRDKRNEPSYVRFVAEKVAELWSVAADDAAAITTANAENLYAIK